MSEEKKVSTKKNNFWGKIALTVSFIGLLIAFVPAINNAVNPPPPPVRLDVVIEDAIKDKAKDLLNVFKSDEKEDKKVQEEPKATTAVKDNNRDEITRISFYASLGLAGLAFCLAMISFVNHESKRFMQASVAVSTVIVGYNYILVAICIALFAMVIFYFMDWVE